MAAPTTPSEIARETLKLLALRRIPPTPDNYLTFYHEIAGSTAAAIPFPDKLLQSLTSALSQKTPDQLRLMRQLTDALKAANWDDYRQHLVDYIAALTQSQKLPWSDLISEVLYAWEGKQPGLTTARKRESLEYVLASAGGNPEILFNRLQSLLRSWGQGDASGGTDSRSIEPAAAEEAASQAPAPKATRTSDLMPELRDLFAFTLDTIIATELLEAPELSKDAKELAASVRKATSLEQTQELLTRLKRFAFKLELLAEDRAELRQSLLDLLRLLVENITELVMDDRWLCGQIEVVRDIIGKPLSQRSLDDAERRLKEIIYKQSELKQGLQEAKEAIKHMLAGFVDHLAEFAGATTDYHDKIEACATRISAAKDISELEDVIGEVMRESRAIQFNALRSRDELIATQAQVREAETRIQELERELETSSQQIRHDHLTGALNRRGLEETLDKEIARAKRRSSHLCLGLLDLDNFKKLNDTHGHRAGDAALVHLTTIVRETLRPQDTVARFGGEEFVIIFPETAQAEAVGAMTRVQRELTKRFFLHESQKILITFSAGIAELQPGDNRETMTHRADEAMYQAKQTGKNKVVAAT